MAEVVEHMLTKHETLSSNYSTPKKKVKMLKFAHKLL
jgi:hypothetical protein